MSTDNTQARLDGVLRANESLASEVARLREENRRLRCYVPDLRNPDVAVRYAGRVSRGLLVAAAAAQRNGHNGLAAILKEQAGKLAEAVVSDPRASMFDIDPPFSAHSLIVEDEPTQRRILDALA